MFILSAILVALFIMALNFVVDPFGVFGDYFYNWFSFDYTNNPRVAKITYLDKHYNEYDSYIIGCSSTSSFPSEALNKYFNAKFYNMIMYGADMLDVEKECKYILENYNPKNIVVNVYISNGEKYDEESDNITRNLHANVDGESKLSFYSRYLFLNPQYAFSKIRDRINDTYLTQPFDVFNVADGAYDKKVRDAEPIGNMDEYVEKYPVFTNYPKESIKLTKIEPTVESIKKIKEMCEANNVNLLLVSAPTYYEYFNYFSKEDVSAFYKAIAEVSPFWDFALSSISLEPRYFYDETHFRNAVGNMMFARIFEDKDVYYPEDFGFYVTKDNVDKHLSKMWDISKDEGKYTCEIPVITFHHISDIEGDDTVTPELLENKLIEIKNEGYTTILISDLISYVEEGKDLPEKPILITFDDGYYSNYEYAFPLLEKYNEKAEIFAIGSSIGAKEFYKNTSYTLTPHFSYDEAQEMIDSGLIDVQSHTYDMHQWPPYESGDKIREKAVRLENESEQDFIDALRNDTRKFKEEYTKHLSGDLLALAFPHGEHDTLTDVILREEGIKATFTTDSGTNTIIKGLPQSIYGLKRIDGRVFNESISNEEGGSIAMNNISVFHSSIRIEKSSVVYFDPYKIEYENHDADVIFITHEHYDHFSPQDINKVLKNDTIIIMPESMRNSKDVKNIKNEIKFYNPFEEGTIALANGESITLKTIPAYNVNKMFHPKDKNWLGYVVSIDGVSYYVAGDTDNTDEAKNVKCDVAFLPCGGTYTMNVEEAVSLAEAIKPETAIPTHYGSVVGSKEDGSKFVSLLKDIKGEVLIP